MSSLSSGIKLDEELVKVIGQGQFNAISIRIKDEIFTIEESIPIIHEEKKMSWNEVIGKIHENGWFKEDAALFVIISQKPNSLNGLSLIQFTPDHCSVKEKMMYSSSKSILVKALANDLFQVFATKIEETTVGGLNSFLESQMAPNPLTEKEKDKALHSLQEAASSLSVSSRSTLASGLSFTLTEEAKVALQSLTPKSLVCLSITNETTILKLKGEGVEFEDLKTLVPKETPLFLIYNNSHSELIFVYISPPSCKIKERMMFASSRGTTISQIETVTSSTIKKKFEVDSVDELEKEQLTSLAIASTSNSTNDLSNTSTLGTSTGNLAGSSKLGFAKPKRPGQK